MDFAVGRAHPEVVVLVVGGPPAVRRGRLQRRERRRGRLGRRAALRRATVERLPCRKVDPAVGVEGEGVERQCRFRVAALPFQPGQFMGNERMVERRFPVTGRGIDGHESLAAPGKRTLVPEAVFPADPVGRHRCVEDVLLRVGEQESLGPPVSFSRNHRLVEASINGCRGQVADCRGSIVHGRGLAAQGHCQNRARYGVPRNPERPADHPSTSPVPAQASEAISVQYR